MAQIEAADDRDGNIPAHSRWTTFAFVAGFALLLCAALAAGIMAMRAAEVEGLVDHTNEVRKVAHDLFSAVQDSESGTRGYLATGDREFLEGHQASVESIPADLTRLIALTSDNPSQQARLAKLQATIDAKLDLGRRYIELREQEQNESAADLLRSKEGIRLMDDLRSEFEAFDLEEAELLLQRQAAAARLRTGLLAVIAVALVAAAALAVLVSLAARRQARELKRANDTLEARVRERTQSLAASEERLRLAQEAGGLGLWDWDVRTDRIDFIGSAFQRWGIDQTELQPTIGGFTRAIHPDDRDRVSAEIETALRGERSLDTEFRVLARDGAVRSLASRGEVFRDAGGAYRMLGINVDVTERREAADALASLNEDLERRVIERTAELEAEGTRRLEAEAQLRQSQKMEAVGQPQLTHRLLAFSRRQPLEPKALEVNRLITGMSEIVRRTLGETIEVETVQGGGLWPAFADANQLENALLNLVVNARDAMPDGGRLTIETANVHLDEKYVAALDGLPPGQYVMLSVADTGTGMSREVLERVFEPFYTTKDTGKGSGLGLPMVYGFVKQSGGHIRIYSEPGHGTNVKIYLPRLVQAERDMVPPAAPAAPSGPLPSARGETILLVEDNEAVRQYGSAALQELGYQVLEADDAASALALIEAAGDRRIDLLFTDVILPGGRSGRQLADEVRLRRPLIPVLFTTGYTRNAIVHHGRLDPDVNLLGKPFTQESLARKVREVLDAAKGGENVVELRPAGKDAG